MLAQKTTVYFVNLIDSRGGRANGDVFGAHRARLRADLRVTQPRPDGNECRSPARDRTMVLRSGRSPRLGWADSNR
jgi:hypothetical protein